MEANCDRTQLPGEVTDIIIDHLHNDTASLSSCGLVCSRWIPTVRFHRFQRVELSNYPSFLAFRDILRSNPRLGLYTTSLICPTFGGHSGEDTREVGTEGLGEALSRLPNLKSLHIYNLALEKDTASQFLQSLPKSVEELEIKQMSFPSIEYLILLWTSLPRLRSFAANGYLRFSHEDQKLIIPSATDGVANVSFSKFHFTIKRHVEHADILVDWLCTHGVLSRLRECSLCIGIPAAAGVVKKILHGLSQTLEILELRHLGGAVRSGSAAWDMGDLAQCTGLRELRFIWPKRDPSRSARWITRILSSIRAAGIKTVMITVTCDYRGHFSGVEELDKIAAALSCDVFKSLERLPIRVLGNPRIPQGVLRTIRESFARYDLGSLLEIDEG